MRTNVAEKAFSVEGQAVTRHVRQLVLEDNWRTALEILTQETTPRLSLEEAVDIISGKLDIQAGPNGMLLVEQDTSDAHYQRHLQNLGWMKAGTLSVNGMFYQPCAAIVGFNYKDEAKVLEYCRVTEMSMTRDMYRQARARVYAEHYPGAIVQFIKGRDPVIFKPVSDPPFWSPAYTDPAAALANFLDKRGDTLEEVGEQYSAVKADNAEFYIRAVVQGVLMRGGDYVLPGEDEYVLQELITSRRELDDELDQVEDGAERFEDGVEVTKKTLLEKFHEEAMLLLYRRRIAEQAERTGGYIKLKVEYPDGIKEVAVPSAPFLHWARRASDKRGDEGNIPQWSPVSPDSLKMLNDNPMHTDWWLGAGLPLKDAYEKEHPVTHAAWLYAMRYAREKGKQCIRLAGKGTVTGAITFPAKNEGVPAGAIAVVPFAGPDYEIALISACKQGAGAVIAATGGKLAHLAIVSRELGARLVVIEDAMSQFKEGQMVTLDLDAGTATVIGSVENLDATDEMEADDVDPRD